MAANLKILGLTLMAVLATTGLVASAAHGQQFTAEEYPASLHGVQVPGEAHIFTTPGGREITCETVTFSGTLNEASTTAAVSPIYEGCHAIVLGSKLPMTITKSGPCEFIFTLHGPPVTARLTIKCALVFDIYANHADHTASKALCQFNIAAQEGLSTVSPSNHGAAGDVTLGKNVSGIAYTRTGSLSCGASGNLTYTGNTLLSATNEAGEPVDTHVK